MNYLDIKFVILKTGFSFSKIVRLIKKEDFPEGVTRDDGVTVFAEHEVNDWLESRSKRWCP